jgi:hypothetical protein
MKITLEGTGSEELSLACFNDGNSHFIMDEMAMYWSTEQVGVTLA